MTDLRPPKPPVRRCVVSVNGARCPEPPQYPGLDWSSFCSTHDDPNNAETRAWQRAPAYHRTLADPDALRGQLDLLTHVAQDIVRDAGTEKWPVNLDRLRMALDEIGALEPTDD